MSLSVSPARTISIGIFTASLTALFSVSSCIHNTSKETQNKANDPLQSSATHTSAAESDLHTPGAAYLKTGGRPGTDLAQISQSAYSRQSAETLFNNLNINGNRYCRYRFRIKPYSQKSIEGFLSPNVVSSYTKKNIGPLEDLITGCWNFYEMNDYRPDLDFQLINRLTGGKPLDCYSVGLLQPYLMDHMLHCRRVSMLDIDWRIHYTHHRILKRLEQTPGISLLESLSGIELRWFAYKPRTGAGVPASPDHLCRKVQHSHCKQWMRQIQPELSDSGRFRYHLVLSPLSKAPFHKTGGHLTPVVFLSNAIEDMYTSEDEFHSMIKRMKDAIGEGGEAYFIHHVGGWKLFGIYKLSTNHRNGHSIRTICKDRYLSRGRNQSGNKPVLYKTHFEKVSITQSPPACSELLR